MRTYKLTISYDGTRYQGWQRQATTDNTIQHILEWSIGKLVGYRVRVDGSGRTDAGVHARGQVASVQLSKLYDVKELKDSINRYLPEDIRIMKVYILTTIIFCRWGFLCQTSLILLSIAGELWMSIIWKL